MAFLLAPLAQAQLQYISLPLHAEATLYCLVPLKQARWGARAG